MSEDLIASTFTDEFTDFSQQPTVEAPLGSVVTTNAIPSGFAPTGGQQQTLNLIQPIQHASTAGGGINQIVGAGSNEATHIQTPIIQQNLNLGNVVPAQVILTNNGSASASTQQPTQYVVQNVGTPVSFVQTTNGSGIIPMMAAPNVQTLSSQHAQLVQSQGGPPRTVIITQRPISSGSGSGAPTIINTVAPKVVTLPGITRPILEKKVTVVTSTGNIANAIASQPIIIQTSTAQQPQLTQARTSTIITSPTKTTASRGRGSRGGMAAGATTGRGRGRGSAANVNSNDGSTTSVANNSESKKKKDPNAPAAPLTAYKFFFKETGQTVKNHNPAAKFGDVSRIVASMWERLSDDEKAIYRKLSEDDKIRYKKELQEYKRNKPNEEDITHDEDQDDVPSSNSEVFSMTSSAPTVVISNTRPKVNPEDVTNTTCIRKGCENLAIRNAEWEDEYCSNECVVAHCKDVFADWVAGNLSSETIKSA